MTWYTMCPRHHDLSCRVLWLLDELDALEILRAHTPPVHRYLFDRLENALRLIERIEEDPDDSEFDD
jgi:hypothetical protein